MSKEWFEKWFSSRYYLELYSHRDEEDARWIINLLQRNIPLPASSRALDIACGAGRHSIELARRGFEVTGFDLSPFLIGEAKKAFAQCKEKDLKLKFRIEDMRKFDFKRKFDIAVNIFSSFGYFDDDASNFAVFRNTASSVRKGGWFLFDFLNKGYILKNIVPYSRSRKLGYTIIQKRNIAGGFIHKQITIRDRHEEAVYDEKLRLYSPGELAEALGDSGFRIVKTFGDYFGNKFRKNESQRFVAFAVRH